MGDTPEYINKMQQEVFEILAEAREPDGSQRDRIESSRGTWTSWTMPMSRSWQFIRE